MTTNSKIAPVLTERLASSFIGLEVRTTNALESNIATAKISALWQDFFSRNLLQQIPQQVPSGKLYGLYTRFASDYRGEFSVVIGAEVFPDAIAPPGLTQVQSSASKYLVFSGTGDMPQTVLDTWQQIWAYFSDPACPYQRRYQTDFESYDGTRPNTIEIYIGVN